MKKRNKKYVPKPVVQNPLNFVFGGMERLQGEHLTDLNVKNHAAMFKITQGIGERSDWAMLVGAANMAIVLCEIHFDMQYHDMLIAGRDALHRVGKRYLKSNRFVLTGDEMTALNNLLEVHEAQLNAVRVIDVERGYQEIQRRLRNHINTKKVMEEVA